MRVYITPEFIEDLKGALSQSFVARVFEQLFDGSGQFLLRRNDHRYWGIEDAWIRYASQGKTGYRIIYIRRKDSVFLYRAGHHSIEDGLTAPGGLDSLIEVSSLQPEYAKQISGLDYGSLLGTTRPMYLRSILTQMMHVGHREVILISPFVTLQLLSKFHVLGRFLDKAIEEDTLVSLVTRPPDGSCQLRPFEELEERGIIVYFHRTVHAKAYLFDVDPGTLSRYNEGLTRTAVLGSANLTESGLGLEGDRGCNDELCYRLPAVKYDEVRGYVDALVLQSEDFRKFKMLMRRF
jgi:phosphatidylserine/phosphatidylglycerophosphate/cardiolipin synthase-like enzyme